MTEIVDYQGKPVPLTADELRMLKQLELYEGSDIRSWRLITIRLALKVEALERMIDIQERTIRSLEALTKSEDSDE